MVSNAQIEKSIGDVPIINYYDILNQAIVNTLHMVNVFKNSEPILGTFTEPHEIARVSTLGIVDVEKNEEKWFYDLQMLRDVVYYYGINEEELKTNGLNYRNSIIKQNQKLVQENFIWKDIFNLTINHYERLIVKNKLVN